MKEIQGKVKQFCKENNIDSSVENKMLDLMSELGEVSKEILKSTDYGKKPLENNENLKLELGDVFYSLITVANDLDIDLDETLNLALNKYKQRLQDKGSIGSRN